MLAPLHVFRNETLERFLAEAACGKPAGCSDATASACGVLARAVALGLEGSERRRDRLLGDAVALELGVDGGVTPAALRQGSGPAGGEALVVDEPGAFERLERGVALGRCDAALLESLLEAPRAVVAVPERPRRGRERLVAAPLAAEQSQPRPVELLADAEPGPDDDLEWQRAPANAVELDRDAAGSRRPQRGDLRHRPSRRRP
jgi:hypothetical protein